MVEKTRLAYQYMQSTYRQFVKTDRVLAEVVATRLEPAARIIFYGPRDEVLEILKIAAGNLHIPVHHHRQRRRPGRDRRL